MRAIRANTMEPATGALVLIEPDGSVLDALQRLLQGSGWTVESSAGLEGLNATLEKAGVTAVISEASVPGCAASDILQSCVLHKVPVIFMGHDVSPQAAVDLMQKGALDFLEKPFPNDRLLHLLNRLRNRHNKRVRPRFEIK